MASEMTNEMLADKLEKVLVGNSIVVESAARLRNMGEIGEAVGREATREKSSRVVNSAKMREALEQIIKLLSIDGNSDTPMCIRNEAAYQMAKEALAAPPRNCDRPECATSNAAQYVWNNEDGGKTAYYEWILQQYEEVGAK